MSVLFAASFPARTSALVLYGSYAHRASGRSERELRAITEGIESWWAEPGGLDKVMWAPSAADDTSYLQWSAAYRRLAASPGAAVAVMEMNQQIDVRDVLPAVRVPTLILHRAGDRVAGIDHGRYLAEHIPAARLTELPGVDHIPWVGDSDAVVDAVEEFLTGTRRGVDVDRVLATVLFTDIVGSTERAAALGDRKWRDVLGAYYAVVRRELKQFRGRELDTAGDGFFASFDGPARAVRCAQAISSGARLVGVDVRAGVHTGECEIVGEKLGGIAVHIGAHIAALAGGGEVLVSNTVKDLVVGSGLSFESRGQHVLKGVPGAWSVYAVAEAA